MSAKEQLPIIIEHIYSLGYDERTLHSIERSGTFGKQIKDALLHGEKEQELGRTGQFFTVPTYGSFNNNQDIAHFDFTFRYDHARDELYLDRVLGRLNGHKAGLNYESHELPSSKEFYEDLKQGERLVLANKLLLHQPTFGKGQRL